MYDEATTPMPIPTILGPTSKRLYIVVVIGMVLE